MGITRTRKNREPRSKSKRKKKPHPDKRPMNEFKTPMKKFVSHKIFREIDVGNCLTDKSSFTPFVGLSGVEPLEKNRKKEKIKQSSSR